MKKNILSFFVLLVLIFSCSSVVFAVDDIENISNVDIGTTMGRNSENCVDLTNSIHESSDKLNLRSNDDINNHGKEVISNISKDNVTVNTSDLNQTKSYNPCEVNTSYSCVKNEYFENISSDFLDSSSKFSILSINSKSDGYHASGILGGAINSIRYEITVPMWGGNTVQLTTTKLTSEMICCKVVYELTYFTQINYVGEGIHRTYPCIFNLVAQAGDSYTVSVPTPNIQSFRWTVSILSFP